jgi:hypothetical protein
LPGSIGKKLPITPSVPAVRMGHLAINQAFEGKGLGSALLADALAKAAHSEIAAFALVVDAKDAHAAHFLFAPWFYCITRCSSYLILSLSYSTNHKKWLRMKVREL